ncbi:conserved membrane hypothetical protein [Flavobacterium sp. 9AF]|uniref:EpsG family protein n=1 Tax=Flavobacterium sp. 9AF TaxID=2653142 RepID=UPI0012F1E12B|nr:EpsG family protein [Flavobacterium sp. 9AF]VXC30668.1 conserved membrane hypothetical protein [Flavobacterium sp. 9AF]
MDTFTSHDWMVFWSYGSFFFAFLCAFRLIFNKERTTSDIPYFPYQIIYVLIVFIAFYFALEPIVMYSDKWNYEMIFKSISENDPYRINTESGFYFYNKLVSFFSNSSFFYFFVTAMVYLLGSIKFINKVFDSSTRYIVFVVIISSLGFYNYGTNTIRQGLALAVFLYVFFEVKLNVKVILVSLLAILLHKSILILVTINFMLKIYNRKDNFISIWIVFLFISFVFGSVFVDTFGEFLMDSDQRMISYLNDTFENYQTGFRIDFLIYSMIPIVFGWLVKKRGFQDVLFDKIFSLYVLVNAIWLLVITLPFTDRFAYLSWFLIPFLFIYPLSKMVVFRNQNFFMAAIIMFLATINLIISTK